MGKIVAIGGGEISAKETWLIDEYIVKLSEKTSPQLLFIPTASYDAAGYIETVKKIYGELGCKVSALCLMEDPPSDKVIQEMILGADIIYVGGGDTERMMNKWREHRVDLYLREAYRKNILLSGISAGSICWFIAGHSDSEFFTDSPSPQYKWVKGLSILPFLHCPHYNERFEQEGFDDFFLPQITDTIALENGTAIAMIGDEYSILRSDPSKKVYLLSSDGVRLTKKELTTGW